MAVFEELNWDHPDVWAVVVGHGIATVEEGQRSSCEAWLSRQGYEFWHLEFSGGIFAAVSKLSGRLKWEEQFGYELKPESRNLSALQDGFVFETEGTGFVMVLSEFGRAWSENKDWARGLLSIASGYSLRQLALGERFFVLIPLESNAEGLAGELVHEIGIPSPFRFRRGVA